MHAPFVERVRIAWPLSALLVAMHVGMLAGCSSTELLNSTGACVQGQSEQCACSSGGLGFRTCGNDSQYGQCFCDAPSSGGSGGAGGVAGSPIGGSAGSPIGGSSGTGGEAAVGGGSTMAGTGGVGGFAGATGGAGAGGVSGMTGGSAGVAGVMISGGTGGVSGMGGTGGSSGMGGTSGDSGPGRDPKPGELYGDCLANGQCDDGLLCVNDGSSGFPETYCSTTCDALNPTCPRSRGDGMVVCLFGICVR
jgi:hypothetical protein